MYLILITDNNYKYICTSEVNVGLENTILKDFFKLHEEKAEAFKRKHGLSKHKNANKIYVYAKKIKS